MSTRGCSAPAEGDSGGGGHTHRRAQPAPRSALAPAQRPAQLLKPRKKRPLAAPPRPGVGHLGHPPLPPRGALVVFVGVPIAYCWGSPWGEAASGALHGRVVLVENGAGGGGLCGSPHSCPIPATPQCCQRDVRVGGICHRGHSTRGNKLLWGKHWKFSDFKGFSRRQLTKPLSSGYKCCQDP